MDLKKICDLSSDRYAQASKRARELGRGSRANRFAVAAGKALTNELRNFKFDITNKDDKTILQSVGIPAIELPNIDVDNNNIVTVDDVIDWVELTGESEKIVEDLQETVSDIVVEEGGYVGSGDGYDKSSTYDYAFDVNAILEKYYEVRKEAIDYVKSDGDSLSYTSILTNTTKSGYIDYLEGDNLESDRKSLQDAVTLATSEALLPKDTYIDIEIWASNGNESYSSDFGVYAYGDGRIEEYKAE